MRKKIIAMIPARKGSTRLKLKNLVMLNKKPLISYSIDAAKKSCVFDKIFVNSDSLIFKKVAKKHNVDFYLRPKNIGKSSVKSDNVVLDFIKKNDCDFIVWVNPISPLQSSPEIRKVVKYFIKKRLNSLITVVDKKVHCVFNKKPVNFSLNKKFQQTQKLIPVSEFCYSIMMWSKETFLKAMKKKGYAILHGKIGYYKVDSLSGVIVKTQEDIKLLEAIILSRKNKKKIKYDKTL